MITTIDNPFDPFEEWDDWFEYDTRKGYNTCCYLAQIACTSEGLSDEQNSEEIERAIDEIIDTNPAKLWRKVVRTNWKPRIVGQKAAV